MSTLEIDGIKNVRKGAILLLVAPIAVVIGLFVVGIIIVPLLSLSVPPISKSVLPIIRTPSVVSSGLILYLILTNTVMIIGDILILLSFSNFRAGFKELPNMSAGSIGGLIGKVGTTILIITYVISTALYTIAYLTLSSGGTLSSVYGFIDFAFLSITLGTIGGVTNLVALILVGIGIYSLGSRYNEGLLKVGGILIATLFLAFIGAILSIIGAGSVRNKLQSVQVQPVSQIFPYAQPQYYQQQQFSYPQPVQFPYSQPVTSQGTIYTNGVAVVQVSFYQQGKVLYAILDDYKLNSIYVNPQFLNAGMNNITIYFPPLQLIQGKIYRIILFIDIGGTVIQYPLNVVSA